MPMHSVESANHERTDNPNDQEPLLSPPLDYGRSFICTKGPGNAPRFWVESRCRLHDPTSGTTVDYYQCGSCKGEHTFASSDLFQDPNYDFLPIFGVDEGGERDQIIFSRHAWWTGGYRLVKLANESGGAWGGIILRLQETTGQVLNRFPEIEAAVTACKLLIGQTRLCDEKTGSVAVLEYPIKTMNIEHNEGLWQVDTGPVLLPDLSDSPDRWAHSIQLAYVAFNTTDFADFVVNQRTPLLRDGQEVAATPHYSGIVHMESTNVLIAQDPD